MIGQEVVVASEQFQPRHHAPGGWRRVMVGVFVGALFGAWATRVVPREGRGHRGLDVEGHTGAPG